MVKYAREKCPFFQVVIKGKPFSNTVFKFKIKDAPDNGISSEAGIVYASETDPVAWLKKCTLAATGASALNAKQIQKIDAYLIAHPQVKYALSHALKHAKLATSTTEKAIWKKQQAKFIYDMAILGLVIDSYEKDGRVSYMIDYPFYVWMYLANYWNEQFLKDSFGKVFLSNPAMTIQQLVAGKYDVESVVPNNEFFEAPKKALQEMIDQINEVKDNVNGNQDTDLQKARLWSIMNDPNPYDGTPHGIALLTSTAASRNLVAYSSENTFTKIIQIIVNGMVSGGSSLPQYPDAKKIKESNEAFLKNYNGSLFIPDEDGIAYQYVLVFDPVPIVNEEGNMNKYATMKDPAETPNLILSSDYIEAQHCFEGTGKCKNEQYAKQVGLLELSRPSDVPLKKQEDTILENMCTPDRLKIYKGYEKLRDQLGLEVVVGESKAEMCERVKTAITMNKLGK